MRIEDRLRGSLQWDPTITPAADPELLDVIVARVARRRRIRVAAVGTAAAAAALLIAVGAPWAISRSELDGQPVKQPTQSVLWTPAVTVSPLDENWQGSSGTRGEERLASLDGTGLERYGQAIYGDYLAHTGMDLQFDNGTVTLSTTAMGGEPRGAEQKALLHGTFTVAGLSVEMRFEEVAGTTAFHWARVGEGTGERLELAFISTTAGRMYGAPAEVFFRMWSAGPFWLRGY
jgi:hypothetical protein